MSEVISPTNMTAHKDELNKDDTKGHAKVDSEKIRRPPYDTQDYRKSSKARIKRSGLPQGKTQQSTVRPNGQPLKLLYLCNNK